MSSRSSLRVSVLRTQSEIKCYGFNFDMFLGGFSVESGTVRFSTPEGWSPEVPRCAIGAFRRRWIGTGASEGTGMSLLHFD